MSRRTSADPAFNEEIADMSGPRPMLEQDDESDLPDDLLESIEDTPTAEDDFGDETQRDEDYAAEEGLELDGFIDPRGEDHRNDDS